MAERAGRGFTGTTTAGRDGLRKPSNADPVITLILPKYLLTLPPSVHTASPSGVARRGMEQFRSRLLILFCCC